MDAGVAGGSDKKIIDADFANIADFFAALLPDHTYGILRTALVSLSANPQNTTVLLRLAATYRLVIEQNSAQKGKWQKADISLFFRLFILIIRLGGYRLLADQFWG